MKRYARVKAEEKLAKAQRIVQDAYYLVYGPEGDPMSPYERNLLPDIQRIADDCGKILSKLCDLDV